MVIAHNRHFRDRAELPEVLPNLLLRRVETDVVEENRPFLHFRILLLFLHSPLPLRRTLHLRPLLISLHLFPRFPTSLSPISRPTSIFASRHTSHIISRHLCWLCWLCGLCGLCLLRLSQVSQASLALHHRLQTARIPLEFLPLRHQVLHALLHHARGTAEQRARLTRLAVQTVELDVILCVRKRPDFGHARRSNCVFRTSEFPPTCVSPAPPCSAGSPAQRSPPSATRRCHRTIRD